jgi:hypothetical protein
VNGRKVKWWQKWDLKDLSESMNLSSMIETSSTECDISKTIPEHTNTYIQGFSPHDHGYNMVTMEKKPTFDVNMEDLIWKCKENQMNRPRPKGRRKSRHAMREDISNEHLKANNEKHKRYTDIDKSSQSSFMYCNIKKSEISEFSDSVQHSISCYPPILYIPVEKGSEDDSGSSTPDVSLTSGLLLQELTSPEVNGQKNQTGHYRSVTCLEILHIHIKPESL